MKIAITGNICSGKSYLSRILMKKYNLELYSFAEKIKKISTDLFKVQHKDRILIQTIADKMKEIDPDIWIKYLLTEINDKENIIIDDLRFENEVKYLKEHGFVDQAHGFFEDILKSSRAAGQRVAGTDFAHVSWLCEPLINILNKICLEDEGSNKKDIKLLKPLANSIHLAFSESEEAAAFSRKVSDSVGTRCS